MADTTNECFLLWNESEGLFSFKANEGDPHVTLGESQMSASADAAQGTMKEILDFLIEAARKTPGVWVSASSRPVKKGQGVI
jgi:hypothetical protein